MAATVLAKRRGMTVLSTTRNGRKVPALKGIGADHVLIDDGRIATQVRDILPTAVVPLHRVYHFDEMRRAHAEMEAGTAVGKIVVRIQRGPSLA